MMSSAILSLLQSEVFEKSVDMYGFMEISDGITKDIGDKSVNDWLWTIFQELLAYNDGYLRFDHDADNQNGHFHPLDHLDIFYSTNAEIKSGVHGEMNEEHFIDLLNKSSECHYTLRRDQMPNLAD